MFRRPLLTTFSSTATLLTATLLTAALAAPLSAQPPCDTDYNAFKGPRNLYLNVHNCGTECAAQELPYLELFREGLTGLRIAPVPLDGTQAPDPNFFRVNPNDPYFQGALRLFGAENLLVLVDDGVDEGPHAKPNPENMARKLSSVVTTYPAVRHIEFMNEPSNFSGITPEEYVRLYLRRAREVIDHYNIDRAADDQIQLYSAAWFGNVDGLRETRRMIRSGGLAFIDVLTAHIYTDRPEDAADLAREYQRLVRGRVPIAVTETNFNRGNAGDYDTQQWWVCDSMTRMERILRSQLGPGQDTLQRNVLYTLRADVARKFNLIGFPNKSVLTWSQTGPGQFVISQRSKLPTDPKPSLQGATPGGEGDDGGETSAPIADPPDRGGRP